MELDATREGHGRGHFHGRKDEWLTRAVEENRLNPRANFNPREMTTLGTKITGLERRKKEIRNSKKRSRRRIYQLTPKIPNMASIPEDSDGDECDDEFDMQETNLRKVFCQQSRRRNSVTSTTSEECPSDEDVDELADSRLPDYMNLGSIDTIPFRFDSFYREVQEDYTLVRYKQ